MTVNLEMEIEELKQRLICIAEENDFDFQHPKVQRLSKELDLLIVRKMKYNNDVIMVI
jgi:hypothetical protein